MGQKFYQPFFGSRPNIHIMVDLSIMQKKKIGQVNIFQHSCKIWVTKVHSNLIPEFNFPITEMFFSEHLLYIMGIGKITKRIVREVIDKIVVKGKRGNKTYLIKDKEA